MRFDRFFDNQKEDREVLETLFPLFDDGPRMTNIYRFVILGRQGVCCWFSDKEMSITNVLSCLPGISLLFHSLSKLLEASNTSPKHLTSCRSIMCFFEASNSKTIYHMLFIFRTVPFVLNMVFERTTSSLIEFLGNFLPK